MLTFTKMSKPLMEKKRRARINCSLEQLKALLEKHYTYNVRKRKLEKADILELTVKHIQNLLSMRQEGMALVDQEGITVYNAGFKGCLTKLSAYVMRTKSSQEKLGLMLIDHINALDPKGHGGHIQILGIPQSTVMLGGSGTLKPGDYPLEDNMGNLATVNNEGNQTNYSSEEPATNEERNGRHDVTNQHIHETHCAPSSCSYDSNQCTAISCHQPVDKCWRPW